MIDVNSGTFIHTNVTPKKLKALTDFSTADNSYDPLHDTEFMPKPAPYIRKMTDEGTPYAKAYAE